MSDQGKTYLAFIEADLKAERDRRAAYDSRGQALITTSGALVTLLAGLAAVTKTGTPTRVPAAAVVLVAVALALFVGAAVFGIVAGWNRSYAVATYATLDRMLGEHWTDDEVDARNNIASMQAVTVDSLRTGNAFKAMCVGVGLVAQVFALTALGLAVAIVIAHL